MCLGCTWGHGETNVAPSGVQGTALSLLTSGHSGLGVSLHSSPAVGPRPCLCDPVRRCVIRSWLSSLCLFIHLFPSLSRQAALCFPVAMLLQPHSLLLCFGSVWFAFESEVAARFRGLFAVLFLWHSRPPVRRRQLYSYFCTCADPLALPTVTGCLPVSGTPPQKIQKQKKFCLRL